MGLTDDTWNGFQLRIGDIVKTSETGFAVIEMPVVFEYQNENIPSAWHIRARPESAIKIEKNLGINISAKEQMAFVETFIGAA